MDIFRKETLRDLSTLLVTWIENNPVMKSKLSTEYNIKDVQKIHKLSEFQIVKVILAS